MITTFNLHGFVRGNRFYIKNCTSYDDSHAPLFLIEIEKTWGLQGLVAVSLFVFELSEENNGDCLISPLPPSGRGLAAPDVCNGEVVTLIIDYPRTQW